MLQTSINKYHLPQYIVKQYLLLDNKKIDFTQNLKIAENSKFIDLNKTKSLVFDAKNQTFKYPIIVEVYLTNDKPKKIIIKRSQMLKLYQTQSKSQFFIDQDFGSYSISYQVNLTLNQSKDINQKNVVELKKEEKNYKQKEKVQNKSQSPINRSLKRPSMLEVGQTAARIRKNSAQKKELKQSIIKIESGSQNKSSGRKSLSGQGNQKVPQLTLIKDKEEQKLLMKKDVKINLFQNFENIQRQKQDNDKLQLQKKEDDLIKKSIKQLEEMHQNHHESLQNSHNSHKSGTHNNTGHEHQNGHGSDHGHEHEHGHEQGPIHLSLKLKTVIAMLIIGFLFLMYDALDDRFSRKITRNTVESHLQYGNDHGKHQLEGKKKKSKKQKIQKIH